MKLFRPLKDSQDEIQSTWGQKFVVLNWEAVLRGGFWDFNRLSPEGGGHKWVVVGWIKSYCIPSETHNFVSGRAILHKTGCQWGGVAISVPLTSLMTLFSSNVRTEFNNREKQLSITHLTVKCYYL